MSDVFLPIDKDVNLSLIYHPINNDNQPLFPPLSFIFKDATYEEEGWYTHLPPMLNLTLLENDTTVLSPLSRSTSSSSSSSNGGSPDITPPASVRKKRKYVRRKPLQKKTKKHLFDDNKADFIPVPIPKTIASLSQPMILPVPEAESETEVDTEAGANEDGEYSFLKEIRGRWQQTVYSYFSYESTEKQHQEVVRTSESLLTPFGIGASYLHPTIDISVGRADEEKVITARPPKYTVSSDALSLAGIDSAVKPIIPYIAKPRIKRRTSV